MERKSMQYNARDTTPPLTCGSQALKAANLRVYFVYGSLMDSTTLQSVIKAREPPLLRPATISGYHLKMWGRYPALLTTSPLLVVHGMAFEIGNFEDVDRIRERLQNYEGQNYRPLGCLVQFKDDGERVRANTFEWVGDQSELKEGVFDLKDYQMRNLESRKG